MDYMQSENDVLEYFYQHVLWYAKFSLLVGQSGHRSHDVCEIVANTCTTFFSIFKIEQPNFLFVIIMNLRCSRHSFWLHLWFLQSYASFSFFIGFVVVVKAEGVVLSPYVAALACIRYMDFFKAVLCSYKIWWPLCMNIYVAIDLHYDIKTLQFRLFFMCYMYRMFFSVKNYNMFYVSL